MTPNIQYQSCIALDEATTPVVTYLQGQYEELTQNPDTGRIFLGDGKFLVVNNNGTYTTDTAGTTLTPDYENRVLTTITSFKYKIKIPYKAL